MNIDLIPVLIGIVIGVMIAVPLTILLDRRPFRARKRTDELLQNVIRLEAERDAQLQREQAHIIELNNIKVKLEQNFNQLAETALNKNSNTFLKLASENFEKFKQEAGSDLDSRQESIKNLVSPLNENLSRFEKSVKDIELSRTKAYTSLEEQLKFINESHTGLKDETTKLVQALRQPKTRGRWGEIQLRNVLELVGMKEHIDFVQEKSFETDEGRKRPDVIVQLPGDRCIIIDAKTPLDAYLSAVEAESKTEQEEFNKSHAGQLREQVKKLANSDYQKYVPNTPDFVVMFIPGESFYSTALEYDPNLFEFALKHEVLITTPMSLVLLLKVIVLGWQQERMTENSREIARIGRELYDRLAVFGNHINDHSKSLAKSVETFNKAVGSMESRVLPSARKLESLDVVPPTEKMPAPTTVELQPRRTLNHHESVEDQASADPTDIK